MAQAEHPWEDYRVYRVFHKNENRWYAQLVAANHRTTITYAKYVMSVSLGRRLGRHEQVHHINEDKLDDRLSNLTVLTSYAHRKLHPPARGETRIDKICPVCNKAFSVTLQFKKTKTCSRSCGGKLGSHRKKHSPQLESGQGY